MELRNIAQELQNNPYPGRGIVLGRSADGKSAVIAYFIMGRSENSRNRIFSITEDGIRTEAYDPSKMSDPSLIIYHPVRKVGELTVVTNGDQTDTIMEALNEGHCYRHALNTRTFEPDGPNYTPRISGVMLPSGAYKATLSTPIRVTAILFPPLRVNRSWSPFPPTLLRNLPISCGTA